MKNYDDFTLTSPEKMEKLAQEYSKAIVVPKPNYTNLDNSQSNFLKATQNEDFKEDANQQSPIHNDNTNPLNTKPQANKKTDEMHSGSRQLNNFIILYIIYTIIKCQ